MLDAILQELPSLAAHFGHLMVIIVLGVLLLSGLGLPVPEDIPLLTAGYLCHLQIVDIWLMIPLTFAAVLGADCTIYYLGRRYGHHVPRLPLLRKYLTEPRLARAELAFHKHGGKTLFIGRFLPGLRAPVFLTAGVFKIPFWKMLAFDGSAALISVPAWVLVAYIFGERIEELGAWAAQAKIVIAAVALLLAAGFIIWKLVRRRRRLASTST